MIQNVLMDLDGTLTDPKDGITRCIQYALGRLGRKAPLAGELLWCIGPPLKQSFARLLGSDDQALMDTALQYYRERFAATGIYENAVYPGTAAALARIGAGGSCVFLATAKPTVFAVRILDYFELRPFFHGIYGSELDGRLTDKTDLVAWVLKTENLNPAASLMVGDRYCDIIGGKRNGVATAAVMHGYGSRAEIESAGPDLIFQSLADLAGYLESNGTG